MAEQSSGQNLSRDDHGRFSLPGGDVAPGRSQPKRTPPRRRNVNAQLLQRIAWSVAAFGVSLALVWLIYGLTVSKSFADIVFENGATTASVALLIGCFALPVAQRKALTPRQHLIACFSILAITPWTYLLGNNLNDAGHWMAPGLNFIFEILLAVTVYRLLARTQATPVAS